LSYNTLPPALFVAVARDAEHRVRTRSLLTCTVAILVGDRLRKAIDDSASSHLCSGTRFEVFPTPSGAAVLCFSLDCQGVSVSQKQLTPRTNHLQLPLGPSEKADLDLGSRASCLASPRCALSSSGQKTEKTSCPHIKTRLERVPFLVEG